MNNLEKNSVKFFFSRVFHKRLRPKIHEFKYNNIYLSVPIRSYYNHKKKGNIFFGLNRFSLISINDSDHGDGSPLNLWIEKILNKSKINGVDGEIWLSTFPKVLRFGFKPVSFWFCENKSKNTVAIIVEVNNTFGEREIYVLSPKENECFIANGQTTTLEKKFYVSPFIEITGNYSFRFFRNSSDLTRETSRIELIDENGPLIITAISGETIKSRSSCFKLTLVYFFLLPLLTIARIHWQAFKLWLKGIKLVSRKA